MKIFSCVYRCKFSSSNGHTRHEKRWQIPTRGRRHRRGGGAQERKYVVTSVFVVPACKKGLKIVKMSLLKLTTHVSLINITSFTANWLEAQTIKYNNFPAKYMNSHSKLHRNIHVVLCQVGVTWNNHRGIGIQKLRDHAERHSAFNSSPKWILLIIYFYNILGVFFLLMWCVQVYWY